VSRRQLYNLMQRQDNNLNLQIAKDSRTLAEASKELARKSKRDSSSMKAIAVLTMFFLPGTAVAVSLPLPYVFIRCTTILTSSSHEDHVQYVIIFHVGRYYIRSCCVLDLLGILGCYRTSHGSCLWFVDPLAEPHSHIAKSQASARS
jgi:hypothetical protein